MRASRSRTSRTALKEKKYNNEIAERYGLVAALLRAKDIPRAKAELAQAGEDRAAASDDRGDGRQRADGRRANTTARPRASKRRLQRYPNKMQLVYDYPEALIKANRPADAAGVCRKAADALSRRTARCTRSPRARTPRRTCG